MVVCLFVVKIEMHLFLILKRCSIGLGTCTSSPPVSSVVSSESFPPVWSVVSIFSTRFECGFSATGVIELHITRDSRNYCFVKFDTVDNTDEALRTCCKPPHGD